MKKSKKTRLNQKLFGTLLPPKKSDQPILRSSCENLETMSTLSLLTYQLEEAKREILELKKLAYVSDDHSFFSWRERAAQLETQLSLVSDGTLKELEIDWLSDSHDCDTCGGSWAEGAEVRLNGKIILSLSPNAYCYDGTSYSSDDVYKATLSHLGFSVKEASPHD